MLALLLSFFCLVLTGVYSEDAARSAEPLPAAAQPAGPTTPIPSRLPPFASPGQPRHFVLLILAFGLCSAWFTLVAKAQQRRGEALSRSARLSNTLNFVTLGLSSLPTILQKGNEKETVFKGAEGEVKDISAGPALTAAKEIIATAIQRGASDIHLEPKGDELQVRYRIDGDLSTDKTFDAGLSGAIISCLKVASDMDIAERRRPQDGSFSMTIENHVVDFRVSTAPSAMGEKMALRLLDRTRGIRRLPDLGFMPDMMEQIRRITRLPHGMLIVSGPTGSGKTSTLYAALSEIDAKRKNIITIENPIEYHLADINQTPINEKAGLTFAKALRSALRQDPDVLLVGEVRDEETAQIAAQSAMTGHLVFTTLHANDSVSSVFRLIDLGLDGSTICTALRAVLAQRLVRKLCPDCRQLDSPSPEAIRWVQKQGIARPQFFKPAVAGSQACRTCSGCGYRGRIGAFELLLLNDPMRAVIQKNPSLTEMQGQARASGLVELRGDALLKASLGMTSMEEVMSLSEM